MNPNLEYFKGKSVIVLGFGVEGKSAVRFMHANGASITVADLKSETDFNTEYIQTFKKSGVIFEFGSIPSLTSYDLIVRSPGVSLDIPELQSISKEKITSVTKLFFDLCPSPIIGVTGTKGKGTTATLIYEMLKKEGKDAYLGGNIGTPAIDFLDQLTSESIVVLELSSFQLVDLGSSPADARAMAGKPHIAIMLMVTSEHLDYHKDISEYVEAKRNLIRHQSVNDFAILNKDYLASNESDIHTDAKPFFISRERGVDEGCFVEKDEIIVQRDGKSEQIIAIKDIGLPGKHNLENACAAVMAATLAGVSKNNIVQVLIDFKGLPHRLELVRVVNGVKYYDDSFSTTPETAEAAIEAFNEPEILILGGSSKKSDFSRIGELISKKENIKAIIGIGEEWQRMKMQFPISSASWRIPLIEDCKAMHEVVQKASDIAEPGDVVLLSPACASFDMFSDYVERGNIFKKAVNSL